MTLCQPTASQIGKCYELMILICSCGKFQKGYLVRGKSISTEGYHPYMYKDQT